MTSVGRHAGGTWMFVVFPDGRLLIEILILCLCVDLGLILNENCLADVRAENAVGFEDDITNEGDMTPLQKHVSFFDRNKDGLIYPTETYQGFRAIGCGMTLSSISAMFINGFLGPKTTPGKLPSLLFPIYVKNINKGKHGSDSGVYDTEGRFVPAKFEEIFEKHALTNADGLTSEELMGMLKSNREPKDHKGWFASWTEWKILYYLCKDRNGMLHKDTIRSVYDGSLFLKMEEDRASAKAKQL